MSNSGAKAALQGYRLQALYILYEVLFANDIDVSFLPEGKEDLDIYVDSVIIRSIQIKSHKANLSYSDFNPKSNDSFFRRSLTTLATSKANIEVVTYGPVGPEIELAWNGVEPQKNNLWKKFENDGFTKEEYSILISKISWKTVSEDDLSKSVYEGLTKTLAGGSADISFEWLMYWIYGASENRIRFTRKDIINKIIEIGKFLKQREAYHDEWFTSIKPLEDIVVDNNYENILKAEFYSGVATRYEHIAYGLDVVRTTKLEEINDAFESGNRAVIVHGASGQGKSSLAYRYFHDFIPEHWRFEVNYIEDKAHAARIALAIADHYSLFTAPVYLLLDVRAGDSEWGNLVSRLIEQQNIKILITIRQEDFARATVGAYEIGQPVLLELEFDQYEAKNIFDNIVAQGVNKTFPSFEDAWIRFGEKGPLMEFVFLLTQAESLRSRLKKQVARLQNELRLDLISRAEVQMLRICAVATAFEARVDVKKLCQVVNLTSPIVTLKMFEKEYFIRLSPDNKEITCLHAIRSEILVDELCDGVIDEWSASAYTVLNVISDESIESFLLYSFSRHPETADDIFDYILTRMPQTWTGLCGVLQAAIWLGIQEYITENKIVIGEARKLLGKAWFFGLDFNFGQTTNENSIEVLSLFERMDKTVAERVRKLRSRQSSAKEILKKVKLVIESNNCSTIPKTTQDWNSYATILFWQAFLKIEKNYIFGELDKSEIEKNIQYLRYTELLKLNYSLVYSSFLETNCLMACVRSKALFMFRKRNNVFNIIDDGQKIHVDFIVPFHFLDGNDNFAKDNKLDKIPALILEQLRLIFPYHKIFGMQGYGHNIGWVKTDHDFTTKTNVGVEHLPLPWVKEVTTTILNLEEWKIRPESWAEYGYCSLQDRRIIEISLKKIERSLIKYFKAPYRVNLLKKIDTKIFQKAINACESYPMLPRMAVDEWGRVSETKEINDADMDDIKLLPTSVASISLVNKYKPLLTNVKDYISACHNFFTQAQKAIMRLTLISKGENGGNAVAGLEGFGLTQKMSHLSAINLAEAKAKLKEAQLSYQSSFGAMHDSVMLERQNSAEVKVFDKILPLWIRYLYKPYGALDFPESRCATEYEHFLRNIDSKIESAYSEDDGIKISVIQTDLQFNDQLALWISIDLAQLIDDWLPLDFSDSKLLSVFKQVDYDSYNFHALNSSYEKVIFILNYRGNVYSHDVICVPLSVLSSLKHDSGRVLNYVHYIKKIDHKILTNLGFTVHKSFLTDFVSTISQKIVRMGLIAGHFADFRNCPKEIDDDGGPIFMSYIHDKQLDLQELISDIGTYFSNSNIADYIVSQNNVELNDVFHVLMDNLDGIMPDSDENNNFTLNANELYEWSNDIYDRILVIGSLNWYFLKAELRVGALFRSG